MELPDGLTGPNDSAYTKTETRNGPPLDYVAEKLRTCIEELHSLHSLAARDLPDDLPLPARLKGKAAGYDIKRESILNPGYSAFRHALVSYLALNNLLAIANDNDVFARLLRMSGDDFHGWLDGIDREGSVI